ncbi:family 1 extracellular solute-binding protein [Basidiobolus meristosporus CBS 931.73]|uniref:Family 1 extracellular solute-binding protein n=1 Tax=Basidiobolus meristosporus CBS 931.73 TaxID=1314790 RepID=A0A1Y1XT49_9FUNG|nr:family 1 extracellular solute-binding protein [Basidiobolus meristosporus CBS 931.73]|eukprot:ORX88910.1 family 1 extracellular solute-binding protein [Basidiobolus meristosporus CBS 931.73]
MKFSFSFSLSVAIASLLPSESGAKPWYLKREEAELQRLYKDTLAEGGMITVYAGGDLPNAGADVVKAFESKFPGTTLNITTDLSKYHNVLIDSQLAKGGDALEPDVTHLQTLHDFPRWKAQGALLKYKPIGFKHTYAPYKDKEGYYWATNVFYFTNLISNTITGKKQPIEARDYLNPKLKGGKIIYTYPHDDDAVLYQFMQLIKQNGLKWFKAFLAQQPLVVRGTGTPAFYINNGTSLASFTTSGSLTPIKGAKSTTIVPKKTFFQSWAQTGAIFKKAKHPAGAKLYVSWLTSYDVQKNLMSDTWSPRTDVPPPAGLKPIWKIKNTDPLGFRDYMLNRAQVEKDMKFMRKYIGPVVGKSPLDLEYS